MSDFLSILEIERFAIHDGPGIRTVVFLQGCPLHCPWCSNPESQPQKPQLMHYTNRCVGCGRCAAACPGQLIKTTRGYPVFRRNACTEGCTVCSDACPENAIRLTGRRVPINDIMQVIGRDADYYRNSGGGVTVSGGEAFVQFDGLQKLLQQCKDTGLHTAVETTGQTSREKLAAVYPLVDLFLFDIKHIDREMLENVCGGHLDLILDNLRFLAEMDPSKITIRVPVIPGFNYSEEVLSSILRLAASLGIENVHLLPYHNLGKSKYDQLDRNYPLDNIAPLSKEALQPYQPQGEALGLKVRIGG